MNAKPFNPASLIQRGMAAVAVAAYVAASEKAGIDIASRDDSRVVQAIGNAAASKGYHHADGMIGGHPYTAAFDSSVQGLTGSQIATWLEELCSEGCVVFFRNWLGNPHIHANFAGVPQKRELDGQNEDFFAGRDGLVGHRRIGDEWWFPEIERRRIPEAMFRLSNPRIGQGRVVSRADVVPEENPVAQPLTFGLYLNAYKTSPPLMWMPVFDGVAYAPVRAWGTALGVDVHYDPRTKSVRFDRDDAPIALKVLNGVGHAPVRQLARQAGLKVTNVDAALRRVMVSR